MKANGDTALPSVSVVVPATDRPVTLSRCLASIELAAPDELIVVEEPAGEGPAAARNAGAARASGELVVFVDSDVEVHSDAIARVRSRFASDPELIALFGSYDAEPEATGAVSGFRNLLHHHVHQAAAGPSASFWAGLGAIRREHFLTAGGFDADRFQGPQIEDIELGTRLAAAGARIACDPAVQGRHLKRWSLLSMLRTDFADRGVPWVALVLRSGAPRDALNLGWRHRISAVASLTGLVALVGRRRRLALVAFASLGALNAGLYSLIARRRGPLEALAGVGLHALHHLAAIAAVPAGVVAHLREHRRV